MIFDYYTSILILITWVYFIVTRKIKKFDRLEKEEHFYQVDKSNGLP